MQLWNTNQTWGIAARLLHWGIAAIILFMLALGVYMSNFVSDTLEQFKLIQIHKSWGFVVFSLALVRLVWRLCNRQTPALPVAMSSLERLAAKLGHLGLYFFLFAMPLSGWLMASASPLQDRFGVKNKVFGQFEMWDPFVPGSKTLTELFANIHFLCAIGLTVLVLGHALAALHHHFGKGDDVLKRMTFGK